MGLAKLRTGGKTQKIPSKEVSHRKMLAQQLNQIKQSIATRTAYFDPLHPKGSSTVEKGRDLHH